jgi:ElaB/YqjD/DUF883 family membrane-anchored ribosome-binding protein
MKEQGLSSETTADRTGHRMSGTAGISSTGDTTRDTIGQRMGESSGAARGAADQTREAGRDAMQSVSDVASRAMDQVSSSETMKRVTDQVRAEPVIGLLVAGAIGFLLSTLLNGMFSRR